MFLFIELHNSLSQRVMVLYLTAMQEMKQTASTILIVFLNNILSPPSQRIKDPLIMQATVHIMAAAVKLRGLLGH